MREGSRGPLKGVASAQKALQGSETETRELLGGTKENSILLKEGSLICPPGKTMIFLQRRNSKMDLVAIPDASLMVIDSVELFGERIVVVVTPSVTTPANGNDTLGPVFTPGAHS